MEDYQLDVLNIFFDELSEYLDKLDESSIQLEQLQKKLRNENSDPKDSSELMDLRKEIMRDLHTIKGNSASVGLSIAAEIVHKLESFLSEFEYWNAPVIPEKILQLVSGFRLLYGPEIEIEKFEEQLIAKLNLSELGPSDSESHQEFEDSFENNNVDIVAFRQAQKNTVHNLDFSFLAGKKIFLIEDDAEILSFYVDLLTMDQQPDISEFQDPWKALNAISKGQDPELVVLDYNLPNINGMKLANRIRKNLPNAVILIISGFILGADIIKYKLDTVNYYFEKPLKVEELHAVLKDIYEPS